MSKSASHTIFHFQISQKYQMEGTKEASGAIMDIHRFCFAKTAAYNRIQ